MINIDKLSQNTSQSHQYPDVTQSLSYLSSISLGEMANVSLLNRVDTKYVFPLTDLPDILAQIQPYYHALEIEGTRLNQYHTVYFDEPHFSLYHQHHNKHATRYKVRARQYVDTDLMFFEVKHKTNRNRTIKSRLPLASTSGQSRYEISQFLDRYVPVDSNQLEPKLWNDYLRLTLVGNSHSERVTIDLDLSFGWRDAVAELPGIAIAEVKQAHFSQDSYFIQQMRKLGIRSTSFSKYCSGVYLLYGDVKTNNFKPIMRNVNRLIQQEANHASHS